MKSRNLLIPLFSLILFGIAYVSENILEHRSHDFRVLSERTGKVLKQLEKTSRQHLDDIASRVVAGKRLNGQDNTEWPYRAKDPWMSVFIFRNDSIIWWSDNHVFPDSECLRPGFRYHENGWYECILTVSANVKVLGMLKIKNEYAFQNRFLVNSFHPNLKLPETSEIHTEEVNGSFAVKGTTSEPLFYVTIPQQVHGHKFGVWIALCYIISYLLFLVAVYVFVQFYTKSDLKAGIATLITVIVTRVTSIYFLFPESLYELPLFSPSYYASSFILNSLGDLLISTILITYLVAVFYRILGTRVGGYINSRYSKWQPVIIGIVILFTFLYSVFVNYLLAGLIINSRISFNINNVFELNVYSLIGVSIIGILLFSFYLVCDGGVRMVLRTRTSLRRITLIFFISQFLFLLLLYSMRENEFFIDYGVSTFLLTNFLMIYNGYIRKKLTSIFAFTRYLLLLFGFSIYAAQTINDFNRQREKENRRLLAAKLENEQDHIAEYLFDDITEKAGRDPVIMNFFSNSYDQLINTVETEDIITRRLTQLYFTGYWGKYDISIKLFNREGLPVNTGGDPTWNLDYFNRSIRDDGQPTISPFLFFTGNTAGKISYIGIIPVHDFEGTKHQTGTIIINLSSKALQDEAGFPELLISDKIPQKKDISKYSYANYRNGQLISQTGSYNYLVNSGAYLSRLKPGLLEQFVLIDGYSHLFYKSANDSFLIVSIQNPGVLGFITLFSYLFSFYGFSFLLIYGISRLIRNRGYITVNFKSRIQTSVIAIVVLTMLLIGSATVYYIYTSNTSNVNLEVNQRLKSMLIAIRDEASNRSLDMQNISDEMNYTFSKLAITLNIDFNIYTTQGQLVYSTQPKIYDQGLKARTMSRRALTQMNTENKSLHIQFERIGNLRYLSAYEPIRNTNNVTVGFINLPYFSRQDELKKDISSFLVALINIYVLLFAFTIFVTFIISGRITQPLQLIQDRLGKIKLGKRNELIEWDRDDEIGALVNEYNRMVEELAESAELLAKSERESAWREMARQVAHEIKNPLTPMKLSVQHLQRAWKENSPNLDKILNQVSTTMIEQIDALSSIATEFSNFAKMPKAHNEKVDLGAIVKNIATLYGENESATITYYEQSPGDLFVMGDKEQLLRVFSNLVKNALQAIPENTHGHIHIELKKEFNNVIVSVRDNGIGIPEAEQQKIFTPNFTTKTGGMGLGLAMVKNIVELAGGTVWFTSMQNEGSVFFVSFPEFNDGAVPAAS